MKQNTEVKSIQLELFGPGMTPLHRAGLGGLACTLQAWQRTLEAGNETRWEFPLRFEIEADSLALHLPGDARGADALRQLFEFAFQITEDGLMFLPGQFNAEPEPAVLADLQAGLLLTFLQHGSSRKLANNEAHVSYCCSENGDWEIPVAFRKCSWFKHQSGWKELLDRQGNLQAEPIKIDGAIYPGASVRHFAYKHQTAIKEPLERVLPLYFALVGCLALPVNRGVGVLLVPEVKDLCEFVALRPGLNPCRPSEFRVTNAADAILQARLRVGTQRKISAVTFKPTAWARQQKSRVKTCEVDVLDDAVTDLFQKVYAALPPRVVSRLDDSKSPGESVKAFPIGYRVDSVMRSLIAENLVSRAPWYAGFSDLMSRTIPVTGKPFRDQIVYEKRGLQQLVFKEGLWTQEIERQLVEAVQNSVSGACTAIVPSRWGTLYEKLRVDLGGAQTPALLRSVLTKLFQLGSARPSQLMAWSQSLAFISEDWQRCRDLSLLALVSSGGRDRREQSLRKSA